MKRKTLGPVTDSGGVGGWPTVRFRDLYDTPCSLQMSSLAIYEKPGTSALWFGPDNALPMVLASKAHLFGVHTTETTGWVPYPIPDDVLLHTRAHLGREQVEALIGHLQRWLDKDKL